MTPNSDEAPLRAAVGTALDAVARRVDRKADLLIAWSGGADSTALLHAAVESARSNHPALRIHAAHIDHGLRDNADLDAQWCRRYARRLSVPLHVVRLAMSGDHNLEARARTRRYAALRLVARRVRADALWTGHHRDDAIETALLHWMRGTGADGFTSLVPMAAGRSQTRGTAESRGMPTAAWRGADLRLQRPLITLGAADIRQYLARTETPWREDDTNRKRTHARNRIRQDVMPTLRAESGSTASMFRTLENLRDEADFVADHVDDFLHTEVRPTLNDESVACSRCALADAPRPVAARILIALARDLPSPVGWERSILDDILTAAAEPTDAPHRFALRGALVTVDADRVTFELERRRGTESLDARRARPIHLPVEEIDANPRRIPWFDGHLEFELKPRSHLTSSLPPTDCAWFDADSLPDELIIHGPLDTDGSDRFATRMQPINFDGHKQLSDLLREAGVRPTDRWRHPCVFAARHSDGDPHSEPHRLLWVPAARQAASTKVTDQTQRVLTATLVERHA